MMASSAKTEIVNVVMEDEQLRSSWLHSMTVIVGHSDLDRHSLYGFPILAGYALVHSSSLSHQ